MLLPRGRRWILAVTAVTWTGCGGASPGGPSPTATPTAPVRRPNIVFLLVDDLEVRTADMMPRLPALIGQHGLSFNRAYVTQSLCAPSRASILTGGASRGDWFSVAQGQSIRVLTGGL